MGTGPLGLNSTWSSPVKTRAQPAGGQNETSQVVELFTFHMVYLPTLGV